MAHYGDSTNSTSRWTFGNVGAFDFFALPGRSDNGLHFDSGTANGDEFRTFCGKVWRKRNRIIGASCSFNSAFDCDDANYGSVATRIVIDNKKVSGGGSWA